MSIPCIETNFYLLERMKREYHRNQEQWSFKILLISLLRTNNLLVTSLKIEVVETSFSLDAK